MGLLDALLSGGNSGGGLLDFLRSNAMGQQMGPGLQSDQAQYQPMNAMVQMQPAMPQQSAQPSPLGSAKLPYGSSPLDNAQWPYGPNGGPSSPFAPSGRSFDSAQFDPQTYAPNQAQPIAVGNYQMPRTGGAQQFTPSPQVAQAPQQPVSPPSTDISAQSRQPQQTSEQPLPPALGGGGYFDRLLNGGGLIRSAFPSAQQQNLTAQYHSIRQTLIDNGESPQKAASKAMVAVMNPEAAKTILPELFTSKEKYQVTSENPIEGKKYGFVNERDQTINGQPLGAGAVAAGSQSSGGLLAPGGTYDPNKTGEDYLNQFSPEVKAAVKAYINGDVLPSGNPRQQGIASQAKTIAQKYGADMGIPVSDALFAEKRKYRTELGTNSANSAGGQAKAFNQGISHLTSLADNLEKLDNSNGFGIPFVAQGANAVRQGVSNQQSAIADEAKSIGQTVAGEVGKLFSGSAGGGVHEREMTRERFDTVKSKPQLAAALRATLETMDGGLKALEQRRDAVLGPNSGVELVNDTTRQNIAKIQGAIDRLEGKSSAPAAAKSGAAGSVQEGATATNPQTGAKITFRNGKWQ